MKIIRRIEDGWNYAPDWRRQFIEEYLVEIAAAKDRGDALQRILWQEADPFIRQGLRYRFAGTCVNQRAISWAFRAVNENAQTGLASRIRAAVVADRFPEEIAELIHLEPAAVVAFEKLFFDARRYLGAELWLESVVQSSEDPRATTPQSARESIWLRTALHEGWDGLQRLWFRKSSGTDAKSLDQLAREIEGIAARRALLHMQNLEETGAPVSDDDLKRLVVLSRRAASNSEAGKENAGLADFYRKLLESVEGTMREQFPDSTKTAAMEIAIAQRMALPGPSGMPVRRRMRALSGG